MSSAGDAPDMAADNVMEPQHVPASNQEKNPNEPVKEPKEEPKKETEVLAESPPATQPATQPASPPASPPASQPATQSASQSATQPEIPKPSSQSASQPPVKPASNPPLRSSAPKPKVAPEKNTMQGNVPSIQHIVQHQQPSSPQQESPRKQPHSTASQSDQPSEQDSTEKPLAPVRRSKKKKLVQSKESLLATQDVPSHPVIATTPTEGVSQSEQIQSDESIVGLPEGAKIAVIVVSCIVGLCLLVAGILYFKRRQTQVEHAVPLPKPERPPNHHILRPESISDTPNASSGSSDTPNIADHNSLYTTRPRNFTTMATVTESSGRNTFDRFHQYYADIASPRSNFEMTFASPSQSATEIMHSDDGYGTYERPGSFARRSALYRNYTPERDTLQSHAAEYHPGLTFNSSPARPNCSPKNNYSPQGISGIESSSLTSCSTDSYHPFPNQGSPRVASTLSEEEANQSYYQSFYENYASSPPGRLRVRFEQDSL